MHGGKTVDAILQWAAGALHGDVNSVCLIGFLLEELGDEMPRVVCLCRRTVTAPTASAHTPQWSGYRRRETASVLNAVPGYTCSADRAEPKCIPKTETDLYQSLSFFDAFNDSAEQLWSRKVRAKVNRTDGDRSRDCFPDDDNRLSSHGASVLHQTAAMVVFRDNFISAGWQEDRPDEFFDNVCREEIRETPLEEKSCATPRL
ncbi:hypothetical protein TcCL_ESM04955 [Trypanosoma cruzi]|uniref:Uncharacterized protein n=1 Tax=Trypanosoma cruzi (strain CL Brener) TaxID=353153 RepID=Q4DVU2_TRYCC|nr:hypothetical protein Tc00.1047053511751.205 [Trypanosoma cruzi]EAN96666.1 hypothetical protein Tc00.1047053511751.205 [Trypanosoma cruzi]RNC57468.1 hypothetical protein TcCL_ESM04955 [Trypanosoma cruzi]|eukprot:XP_818517.1 hypothetical protein [Trypanosoma cruzi strain CL Brener]